VQVTAFCVDPLARWALPESPAYVEGFSRFVDVFMGPSFDHDAVDVADDFAGVAFWLPPGADVDFGPLEQVVRDIVQPSRRDELFVLFEQMDGFALDEPHWHLSKIGVDPVWQGSGVGSVLMRHRLAICDRDRLQAYLESSNPANLPFYERLGFQVMGEIQTGSSPIVYPMLRRPA
jgi:ribosomal protein S18 acetylase RimI-like enzyme